MNNTWIKQTLTTDFYNDYPTNRENSPGALTKRWYAQSRNWMKKYLMDTFNVKAENIIWRRGYYEWTMFAKIGEQWWYFSTGDIRSNIMRSMLVRKAQSPRDYTGGMNRFVGYDNNFEQNLTHILRG